MIQMSTSVALRYVLELLKAGDETGAKETLEDMIRQASEQEAPSSAAKESP